MVDVPVDRSIELDEQMEKMRKNEFLISSAKKNSIDVHFAEFKKKRVARNIVSGYLFEDFIE